MRNAETISVPTPAATSFLPQALTWAGASALAVPAAVLLHELGHFVAHLIFGFSGPTLHYSSTTYELERALRSVPRQQRAAKLGGLLVGIALGMVVYFKFAGPWLLP